MPGNKLKGIVSIIVSAFGFSLMALFVRLCDDCGGPVSAFQKGFFRNIVAFAIALVVFLRTRPVSSSSSLIPRPSSLRLTPQFIGKDPVALRACLERVKAAGYETADLNCGCPFPMVRNKGRGSGLLSTPEAFERMLAVGCETMGPGRFSVKDGQIVDYNCVEEFYRDISDYDFAIDGVLNIPRGPVNQPGLDSGTPHHHNQGDENCGQNAQCMSCNVPALHSRRHNYAINKYNDFIC